MDLKNLHIYKGKNVCDPKIEKVSEIFPIKLSIKQNICEYISI
jgi:hypothetical protein